MPEAVPTYPGTSLKPLSKAPSQRPLTEAGAEQQTRGRAAGWEELPPSSPDHKGWARPTTDDSQGCHRIILNPAPLPASRWRTIPGNLPPEEQPCGQKRRQWPGVFLPAPTLPTTPRTRLSDCLSHTVNHNNTLPWLGTVTAGYRLILPRALCLWDRAAHRPQRTQRPREGRNLPRVTQLSQVWVPQAPWSRSHPHHPGLRTQPGSEERTWRLSGPTPSPHR